MTSGRKNPFTEKEDQLLVQYIAKNKPEPQGRTGNNLYINLVDNEEGLWPWAKNHPWQSWRERYRKDQERFDHKIRKYQKERIRMKSKKVTVEEEGKEGEGEEEDMARENVASSSKTKLPPKRQPQDEGSSSKSTMKKPVEATTKNKTEDASKLERTVKPKPIPKPTPEKVAEEQDEPDRPEDEDQEPEILSEELMHDLFGSFIEEDEMEELTELSPKANVKSPQKVYPDVADLPAPTMGATEFRMPGAFEAQPLAALPEPAKPKYVPAVHETPSKPSRPPPKKRKRKEEEDPFQSPPSTPPPPPRAPKKTVPKQPPTIVEGPFRNTLKPTHESRTADNNDGSEWPPKRRKKNDDHYDVPAQPQQQQNTVMPPKRPAHVNAVASSSKTQLPPSHATYHRREGSATVLAPTKDIASSIPRLQTEPSLKPLGNDVSTRPSIEKKGAERRTLGDIPINHHDQPPAGVEKPSQNAKDTRTVAQRPSSDNNELSSKTISRTGSHDLPTKPTSDNDPFTTNHVSDKAAGKARADHSSAIGQVVTKPPRRIDFYQENLSKRLRAKASLPSRRSSVVSSRTSTTSSTAKKTGRRSSSFRQSITALDIPDEAQRAFALVAAEDIASIMEQMAKDHGVSLDIAMKTYMRTRSILKTQFILGQFLKTLQTKEQDLYAQMPDLTHVSDDEGEDDSDRPEGLVSNKTPEIAHTTHPRHSNASRRRSNRPSLNIKPAVEVDDPVSDYSPPNASRAGQFARLVKQNRKQEAIEREKRRVSGQAYQLTQLGSPNKHLLPSSREITVTPTPHRSSGSIAGPMEVDKPAEEEDNGDDMYVDEEPTPEPEPEEQEEEVHVEDADDESDSGNAQEEEEETRAPSPSLSSLIPQTVEEQVVDIYNEDPELALEHQMLALNVNKDNVKKMRKFQARQDPDFLRFMSIRLVGEILAADAQDSNDDYEEY